MTDMPDSIEYGHVTGRFILAIGDGTDPDRMPDAVPAADVKVKFTPKAPLVRVSGATPTTIVRQAITCTVDADGRLVDTQEALGVWLTVGVYGVTYSSAQATIPAHDIEVTSEHTEQSPLDLTGAMPPGGPVLTPSQYAELSSRLAVVEAGGGGGAVDSVNGQTGAVTLDASDVSALPDTYTPPAQSWGAITGKPSTFTPSAHTHAYGDITDPPTIPSAAGDVGALPDTYVPTWGEVTGKPSTFTPSSHTHSISDVSGLQGALDDAGTIPAGSTLTVYYNGGWPSRPTARTDLTVQWIDLTGSAGVPAGAIEDHDLVIVPDGA